MKDFQYVKAESVAQAVQLLAEPGSRVIAGGSAMLLRMKHEMLNPGKLINIRELSELVYIREEGGLIKIGAGTTLDAVIKSQLLQEKAPLLVRIAKEIGSPEVRNMATLGGNLCVAPANCGCCFMPGCPKMTAKPGKACQNAAYADMLLPLIAYQAKAKVVSAQGEREIAVAELLDEKQHLTLKAGELMTEISFASQAGKTFGYNCLRRPNSMGLPLLAVIVEKKGDQLGLTLGGSVRGIVCREAAAASLDAAAIAKELVFNECLLCEAGYRERVAGQIIRRAVADAEVK